MVENLPGNRFPTRKMDLFRIAAGLSFLLSGLTILLTVVRLPDSFFGAVFKLALLPVYAQAVRFVILPRALLFAWLLGAYQVAFGACILAQGKWVQVGLAGFVVFLVCSLPAIGFYSLLNVPVIFLVLILLRKRYARSVLDVIGSLVKKG